MVKELQRLIQPHKLFFSQIIAIIGFLSVFFLSSSLESLRFKPGTPLPTSTGVLPILTIGKGIQGHWLVNLFLISLFAMFPIAVILLIFSSEARKVFRKYAKALIIWFLFLLGVRFIVLLFNQENITNPELASSPALPNALDPPSMQTTSTPSTLENYVPSVLPEWLGYLIGFFFIFILGIVIYFYWSSKNNNDDSLSAITLKTIRDIQQGRRWEDAVIECYAQMNTTISQQKQIQRKSFLTPTEYARELISFGLPFEPVHKLTQLFEHARYGHYSAHEEEKKLAIHYLEKITCALESTE